MKDPKTHVRLIIQQASRSGKKISRNCSHVFCTGGFYDRLVASCSQNEPATMEPLYETNNYFWFANYQSSWFASYAIHFDFDFLIPPVTT